MKNCSYTIATLLFAASSTAAWAPRAAAQEPTSQPAAEVDVASPAPEPLVYPGPGDVTAEGVAGGPNDASAMGLDCIGFVSEVPNHILTVTGGLPDLYIDGGEHDLSLVVVGTSGVRCVDDAFGRSNPFMNLWDAFDLDSEGELQIFVGTKDGEPHPYQLRIEDSAG